ncbi:MAG: hypothetical protein GX921_07830 [Bacteroidales bacterium]|nr:hypothetical protein [Bacteroidales bacterium]
MKKIISFLEKWIKLEVHDTNEEGVYQIYAGVSKNGIQADVSTHGFNLYFGNEEALTKDIHEYGFSSVDSFKRAVIISLYYISRISAEEIVGEHIVAAIRKGNSLEHTDVSKYIWEGNSEDCSEKWSIYIDLRNLE